MKKLLIILLFPISIFAQQEIQVSEDYNSILIFPSEIDLTILGNDLEYYIKPIVNNSAISKRTLTIGYIKIENVEKDTNLTVFTKDGNSYSFSLKYAKTPNKLDPYRIGLKETPNNKKIVEDSGLNTVKVKDSYYTDGVVTATNKDSSIVSDSNDEGLYETNKIAYIENYCEKFNETKKIIFNVYDKVSTIKLSLKHISYSKDELYFHFLIKNSGGQTFDVDFINTKLARDYKGVSTDQSIPLTPLYIYNNPERVLGKSEHNFIMVFKKFSINDKKSFQIDLAEKEGERNLLLSVDYKLVNDPIQL